MQLRCVELTEFTPPSPKISGGTAHAGVVSGGHTLSLGCPWQDHCPYGNHCPFGGGGIFTSPIRNCLSVCAYVLRASGTDLPQTQTGSDSARAELRESRDLAHDCQSRELRSHTTHAGVVTICTVPEMDAGCLGHTQIYVIENVIERRDVTPASPARLQR